MPLPELYTLDDVAKRLGWTRLKLILRLKTYRIRTIGIGKDARLSDLEVQQILNIERQHGQWALLTQGEKIAAGKKMAREIREGLERKEREELLALLPPPDPETQERIRKSMERSRRMKEAYARKKLRQKLGFTGLEPSKKS